MPVGGDITRFFLGPMSVLRESYLAGRLPLWNDLWGFGFPGLAESQMGVYYPPHWVLYGLLPTTAAYTASLVLHTLWGAIGAGWAARSFGASRWGSVLAGVAWGLSGFHIIHLPHQWGYTVGSWMPWAWGLAWPIARGDDEASRGRRSLLLSAVLALQVLPGHFQLAFETQVTVLALALWALVARGWRVSGREALILGVAVGRVFPLSAAQLLPTWQLAQQAGAQHDFEYLSGFATPPLMLLNYVAPGLFHGSPLWRPVVWDVLHSSPEECLGWVGIPALFLAVVAVVKTWRDPATRALVWLGLGATVLALGPYAPGFRGWILLPGFSFFRAPARWSLAAELSLALLAGRGLRVVPEIRLARIGFSFGAVCLAVLGLALATVEVAIRSANPAAPSRATLDRFDAVLGHLPWPPEGRFADTMARAWQPPRSESFVTEGLRRQGKNPLRSRLGPERGLIYVQEVGPTVAAILGLMLVTTLVPARRVPVVLLGLAVVELVMMGHRLRPIDSAPLQSLPSISPVMARLAQEPRGTCLLSSLGNLPMAAGVATFPPYRTLDVPFQPGLGYGASLPHESRGLLGIGAVLTDPPGAASGLGDRIVDPALTSWLRGLEPGADPSAATYAIHPTPSPVARAWLVEGWRSGRPAATVQPSEILTWLSRARPLPFRSDRPERVLVEVETDANAWLVVVAVLNDPEWEAVWRRDGRDQAARIEPIFVERAGSGGWMAIAGHGSGRQELVLIYRGRAASLGLLISGLAWIWCGVAYWRHGRPRADRPDSATGDGAEQDSER
jgi:hypothetical protein